MAKVLKKIKITKDKNLRVDGHAPGLTGHDFEIDDEGNKNYQLPPAYAVVNPKQEDCKYPFSGICGAMVAYKLIQVLYDKHEKEVPDNFLEMAAFATICDVMELKDEKVNANFDEELTLGDMKITLYATTNLLYYIKKYGTM